jgi:hypothetical protein
LANLTPIGNNLPTTEVCNQSLFSFTKFQLHF